MKAWLVEAGEVVVGTLWWGMSYLWGAILTVALLLTPLLVANLAVEIVGTMPATVALGGGVVAAYALNLPPWDAGERLGLLLVVGGAAASVVAWDLMRGSADIITLIVAVGLAAVAWPIRRAVARGNPFS